METYDVIVIGSGPAGYVAAERSGSLDKRVLLIEKDQLGGVCTNRGCIPTKSLLHAAKTYRHARDGEKLGVVCQQVSFDLSVAMAWKRETVETLRSGIQFLMKNNKVEVVSAEATLVDAHHVKAGEAVYEGASIIIATGSSPAVPPIPGADRPNVVTSDGILEIEALPASLVVVGGGVIGIEFASFFSSVGVQVTVIEMMDEILPMMDAQMAKLMRRELKDVTFRLGCKVQSITAEGVDFTDSKGKSGTAHGELVLLSVGRRPNLRGTETLGLAVNRSGIIVDDRLQTNVAGVYAIGDVNGRSLLAHSASRMAEVVVSNLFGTKTMRMRWNAIPWAVYGLPEAAGCGITEQEATKQGRKVLVGTVQMRSNGRFLAENGKRATGLCKVIADEATKVILGIHLLGPYSSEIIAAAVPIIEAELRVKDVKEIVFPHPSVAEIIKDAVYAIDHTL